MRVFDLYCEMLMRLKADAVNKDRKKKNFYSGASILEATVIPMCAIFPLVTDAYRSAEASERRTAREA